MGRVNYIYIFLKKEKMTDMIKEIKKKIHQFFYNLISKYTQPFKSLGSVRFYSCFGKFLHLFNQKYIKLLQLFLVNMNMIFFLGFFDE